MKKINKLWSTIFGWLIVCSLFLSTTSAQNTFPSSGNAGVGTTSPFSGLELRGQNSQNGITFRNTGDDVSTGIYGILSSGNSLKFRAYTGKTPYTGISELLTLKSNGNFGIGEVNPDQKLDVNGNIQFTGGDRYIKSEGGYIGLRPKDATHGVIIRDYTGNSTEWTGMRHVNNGSSDRFEFSVENSGYGQGLVLHQNDNVSIGTTASDYPFLVSKASATWQGRFQNGSANVYIAHGDGYGLNVNSGGSVASRYALYVGSGSTSNILRARNDGKIVIGQLNPNGSALLTVNGTVCAKEVAVTTDGWADFVFEKDYSLMSLEEVENYVQENKHLPDVPSEAEILENGINLGKMDAILLRKIEELMLYTISQENKIKAQEIQLQEMLQLFGTESSSKQKNDE